VQIEQKGQVSGPLSSNRHLQDAFVEGKITAKVSDFGLSKRMRPGEDRLRHIHQGTPFFMAPEVSHRHELYPQSDVYSYGVIMWEVMMGIPVCYEQCVPFCQSCCFACGLEAKNW
jgi:serine/threonine protein kinase